MSKLVTGVLFLAAATCAMAQQWEFGGVGGYAFLNTATVTTPSGSSATAGFQHGGVVGALLGQNISAHVGGEIRYEFMQSNLLLQSGGTKATFSGQAHTIHYDLLLHTNRKKSPVEAFVAIGGGLKVFRGTGTEAAYQPLYQFGYFTKTQTLKPMATVGGGLVFIAGKHLLFRTEVRDFITAFPTEVLTPPAGVKYPTLLHDLVPMFGVSYAF